MLTYASMMIMLRQIRKVHWLLILLTTGIFGVFENGAVAAGMGVLNLPDGLRDCLLTYVALPISVFTGQITIMLALKFEEAAPVALVSTSGVVFSFLLQFAFFGIEPDIFSVVGGTIVILGVIITTSRKWVEGLPPEDERKRRLTCLLR